MKLEQSLAILPSKKFRKEEASSGREVPVGKDGGSLRERMELRVDQSCLGLFLCLVMRERKYVQRAEVINLDKRRD